MMQLSPKYEEKRRRTPEYQLFMMRLRHINQDTHTWGWKIVNGAQRGARMVIVKLTLAPPFKRTSLRLWRDSSGVEQ